MLKNYYLAILNIYKNTLTNANDLDYQTELITLIKNNTTQDMDLTFNYLLIIINERSNVMYDAYNTDEKICKLYDDIIALIVNFNIVNSITHKPEFIVPDATLSDNQYIIENNKLTTTQHVLLSSLNHNEINIIKSNLNNDINTYHNLQTYLTNLNNLLLYFNLRNIRPCLK